VPLTDLRFEASLLERGEKMMNRIKHQTFALTLLVVAATILVGSFAAATGAASPTVSSATLALAEQHDVAWQAQQPQPESEPQAPIGGSITYQGRLKDGPNPANGQYDFQFKLFDAVSGGTQVGATINRSNQPVSEGLVTVGLDFGTSAFQGQARYLEVAVRPAGGGQFATLSPRQTVSPAPYAIGLSGQTVITGTYNTVTLGGTQGVKSESTLNGSNAIMGQNDTWNGVGVRGISGSGYGVKGNSSVGYAVYGESDWGYGVYGESIESVGVRGISTDLYGVSGRSENSVGVYGDTDDPDGEWAGYFSGNVNVTGSCCGAGAGLSRIDHPLDPANKYLSHSYVESPDMMNVYNGNVTTDAQGEAVVALPTYFEALNKDFRYQLTVVGQFAQAVVWKKIEGNRFTIKTDKPNVEVSWQVTGIRKDRYAEQHRIRVEEDKGKDRGKYLHPIEHGQPESKGIGYEEMPKPPSKP
jgi:hypothetical protein